MQDDRYKDEIEFRDLLRKPRNLFGYGYLYFLGLLLFLGVLYAWDMTLVGKNAVQPAALKDSSAFVDEIPLQSPAVLPPVDVMKAGVPSDSLIARGRELFRTSCSSCHGEEGRGDGPTAATLNPKPRNFHSLSGWTNGSKVSQIYRTLQDGIVKNGMAAYNYLPPADRFALAHLVRTFAPGQPQDSPEDLGMLETQYQLSKGSRTSGQIPVRRAERIVLAEDSAMVTRTLAASGWLASPGDDAALRLLHQYSADPTKTAAAFRQLKANQSLEEFRRSVSASPGTFGLKPGVARLTEGEWRTLQQAAARLQSA